MKMMDRICMSRHWSTSMTLAQRHLWLRSRTLHRVTSLLSLTLVCCLLYLYTQLAREIPKLTFVSSPDKLDYTFRNGKEGCRIPDMAPRHQSIVQFLSPAEPIVCSLHDPLTYTAKEGGRQVLRINKAVVTDYVMEIDRLDCCYAIITRVSDNKNRKGACYTFKLETVLDIDTEFISVSCLDKLNGIRIYSNMHAVVQIKPPLNHSSTILNHRLTFLNHARRDSNQSRTDINHSSAISHHSKSILNHSRTRFNHSRTRLNNSKADMNHTRNVSYHSGTNLNHSRNVLKHSSGIKDHSSHGHIRDLNANRPKMSTKTRGTKENLPNILLLGIDSISRLSLIRNMPRTIKHLQANSWIELRKYNKIGDNTLPNLMAILSPYREKQLSAMHCWRDRDYTRDHCPYMWKDFKKKGYVTAYAEDEYYIGTFNHETKGFENPPTDYYFRPFIIEAMRSLHVTERDFLTVCLGPTSTTDHYLKYTKDLLSTFDNSLFALIWLNNFSHDNLNTPAAMDDRYLDFMQDLSSSGALRNTFVVFYSDHGARFGDIRKTYVGWLEERLPFIYIWVPEWFRVEYPEAYHNLVGNADRLTSPYDLHLTLKDIVDDTVGEAGNGSDACPTCASLFAPVPANRSCEEAGISAHWCTCALQTYTSTLDPVVRGAAEFAVSEIDRELDDAGVKATCATLRLNTIYSARKIDNSVRKKEYEDFVIILDTLPGLAMFDVTVTYRPKRKRSKYKVIGLISRINSYANQSKCISDTELKLYCHCLNS